MAGTIKGITIELNGDTTKLTKALKESDSEIRNTQKDLRAVESALKLNPSSTELLTQKQKLLSESVSETKDKLETLKTAEKQAREQLANGEIGQSEFEALQREIAITESKLEGLEDEYKNFGSVAKQQLTQVGTKLKDTGSKISSAGETVTKYATTAVVAVGAASVAAFQEVDGAMDAVVKKTGATGQALTDMQDIVSDIATTIPTSFDNAGVAVGEVNTRFRATGKELKDLSTEFIKFAEINDTDLNTSIDSTSDLMHQFGLKTSDMAGVLGKLTKVSQDTGISVDDLENIISQNGSTLRDMGLSVGESISLLGNFEAAGVDSATALSGMTKAAVHWQKEGVSVSDGLKDIVSKLSDGEVSAEDYAQAVKIFGNKAADKFADMCSTGRFSLEGLSSDLQSYSTTVTDTFDATLDPIDQATVQLNNLKQAGADLAAAGQSTLLPIVQSLTDGLKQFTAWFGSLSDEQKDMTVKVGLAVAALGPVLIVVGKIVTAIGSIITFVGNAAGAISTAGGAISGVLEAIGAALGVSAGAALGIIALIIAAIAAVGYAIYTIVANIDDIKYFFADIVAPAIVDAIYSIGDFFVQLGTTIAGVFQTVFNFAVGVWAAIVDFFSNIISSVTGFFTGLFSAITNGFQAAYDYVTDVWSGITGFFGDVVDGVTGFFGGMWDTLTAGASAAVDAVQGFFGGIGDFFQGVVDNVKSIFNFDWHFPDIALPHFSIQGSFSLNPPSVPYLGVDWYDKGGVFDSPSVIGVGEKRPEFVGALDDLRKIVREESGTSELIKAITALTASVQSGNNGNMTIPVYVGGNLIDEAVITAQKRNAVRSGGRA